MSIFSRKRDNRKEQPLAVPGASMYPGQGGQWGPIELPSASSTVVLGLPAASRAVSLISNAVAAMAPLDHWTPDGFIADETPQILKQPNVAYDCFDFWQMAVAEAIMHGNFLGILADFADGYPQQIVPVPHGFWMAYYDAAGFLVYRLNADIYSREEVFHVRVNATPNVPMGIGVVTQYRRALGQALDQQNFSADTYRSGSVPAGIIALDKPEIDAAQAEAVTAQWIGNHAGGRAPAVLPNNMKFTPLAWSPEQLEFLESRKFTVAEIAMMFGLDASDLGAAMGGSSITYANIEQRQQARITDSYGPWMHRFEQALSRCIPDGEARFDADKLLRTDTMTRAQVHQLNIGIGVESVDEARKTEGRHPLPPPPPIQVVGGPSAPGATTAPGTPGTPEVNANGAPVPVGVPGAPHLETTPLKVKF